MEDFYSILSNISMVQNLSLKLKEECLKQAEVTLLYIYIYDICGIYIYIYIYKIVNMI